jgi:hypothetical protein
MTVAVVYVPVKYDPSHDCSALVLVHHDDVYCKLLPRMHSALHVHGLASPVVC